MGELLKNVLNLCSVRKFRGSVCVPWKKNVFNKLPRLAELRYCAPFNIKVER